jgi:uncharacterized protein
MLHFNNIHNTNNHTLLRVISGSKAYALNTANSDTDIRGVFLLPKSSLYSIQFEEQYNDDKNDTVYYELRKLMELLLKNNPNTLDLIATPTNCILYKHPIMDKLQPELFLSKLCQQSFAGYAKTQIQRARGLNKKIINPMDKHRKGLLDFCWIGNKQGSTSLKNWLAENNIDTKQCGCIAIDHMKNCYHLFVGKNYKGITDKDDVQIILSSIEKNETPALLFYCNIEGFQKYCNEYNEYWKWVSNRNEDRYENTMQHGKQYDAKNMMHTFRLLNMAYEIATEGAIHVYRKDREELLKIRSGAFEYEYLIQLSNEKLQHIEEAFANCSLPDEPNKKAINTLLIEMREELYK